MTAAAERTRTAVSPPDAADLVSGRGVYFQDLALPGAVHLFLVRSPDPHARIVSVDSAAAVPRVLAAALGLPEHRIRVIAPRPGGSFGRKMPGYPEEVLVCALAKRLNRPVRWLELALAADGCDVVTTEGQIRVALRGDLCR